jgi:hypothetical protein
LAPPLAFFGMSNSFIYLWYVFILVQFPPMG